MMKGALVFTIKILLSESTSYYEQLLSSKFSQEVDSRLGFEEAKKRCESRVSCAGVSEVYDNPYKNDTDHYHVIAHSFLSNLTENTYQSLKPFILHKGKIRKGTILSFGHENMTVEEAKGYCKIHPKCAAFFYPVHSLDLTYPDNITFVSSVNQFDTSSSHNWYTFISNDLSKAKYINETGIDFDDNLAKNPYPTCCTRNEIPTLEEVEAVDTFERIPCNISREEFRDNYEKKRKPVMLVGCDKDWKAKERWNYKDLIKRFGNSTPWRTHLGSETIEEEVPWYKLIDAMTNDGQFYIFDPLDRPHQKTLYQDYSIPAPIQGGDLYSELTNFPSEDYGSLRWFCVSSGSSGTHPHTDPVHTDAWNSITKGHKWWILFPDTLKREEDIECDPSCSVEDLTPRNWYASVGVNAARLEYPGTQRPMHIIQKAGETIYVPFTRVHSVFNMDATIAVTANYGSEGNVDEVWKELVTSRNKKFWQKAYYEVFTREQRKQVREGAHWPPSKFEDSYDGDSSDKFIESSDDDSDSDELEVESEDEQLNEDEVLDADAANDVDD